MEVLQNPVVWRAMEHSLMMVGAVVLAIIGYRLFIFGIFGTTKEGNNLSALERVMLGTGPGLFFLGFAAVVLIAVAAKGGGSIHAVKDAPSDPSSTSHVYQPAPQQMGTVGEDSGPVMQWESPPPAGAAREVLGKQAVVNDSRNAALVEGNFAALMQDFTPVLLAPREGYVVKALGEEAIRRHAVTEFELKFQDWRRKNPHPMLQGDLLPPRSPRARLN
jgi:hypothetical protein